MVQYIRNLIPKVAQEAEASRLNLGRKLGFFVVLRYGTVLERQFLLRDLFAEIFSGRDID